MDKLLKELLNSLPLKINIAVIYLIQLSQARVGLPGVILKPELKSEIKV